MICLKDCLGHGWTRNCESVMALQFIFGMTDKFIYLCFGHPLIVQIFKLQHLEKISVPLKEKIKEC